MSFMRLLTAGKSWVGIKDPQSGYRMTDPRSMPKFGGKANPFRKTTTARVMAEENVATEAQESAATEIAEASVEGASANRVVEEQTERDLRLCEPQRTEESIGLVVSDSLRSKDPLRLAEPQAPEGEEIIPACLEPAAGAAIADAIGEETCAPAGEVEPEPESESIGCVTNEPGQVNQARESARASVAGRAKAGLRKIGAHGLKVLGGTKALAQRVMKPVAVRMPKYIRAEAQKRAVQTELALDSVKVIRNDLADADFEIVTTVPRRVRASKATAPAARAASQQAIEKPNEQPVLMPEPVQPVEQMSAMAK